MTTQKNAATILPAPKKEEISLSVVPKIAPPEKITGDQPPLEDRILRINQLFDLHSRYHRLLSSENKLNVFKMKKGEENISFTIRDKNNREEFETSNPAVITAVLDCVRVILKDTKKALEPQLKW